MATQIIEKPAQPITCATCPYFQDFGEPLGRGWCHLFDQVARQHHFRTGDCDQEIEAVAEAQQPTPPPTPQQIQPAGSSGDSTGCQLRPTFEAPQQLKPEPPPTPKLETEFALGRMHGQNDALSKWYPIYKQPVTEYATGYLAGYNACLNPTDQQPESKPLSWLVCLDPQWGLYQVWVGGRCLGHGATYQEAERKAQAYIGNGETIKRQNAAVMASYAA